ncbi:MAG TPA: hypothetical protein VNG53_09215 [Bacteroidia bacterium]|nr:hypothetical protein [Bacteroidia bacterium]
MKLQRVTIRNVVFVLATVSVLSFGCKSSGDKSADASTAPKIDSNKTTVVNVNWHLFSIPSPIQTAFLIQKSGATYDKTILNPAAKSANYSSNFQKAINLGVYGADLGYVTMYDQPQDAIAYLHSVKTLADALGVSSAFDKQTLDRFQKNIGNKDSLLMLVSVAYRESDAYLKNNQRNNVSGLILAGGWIESLNFATDVLKTKNTTEIQNRIADQKTSLQSLIAMLTPYTADDADSKKLVDNLNDLSKLFDAVQIDYQFVSPTVDVPNKTTTVNSKSDVKITPEQIQAITQKIQSIRTQIVG